MAKMYQIIGNKGLIIFIIPTMCHTITKTPMKQRFVYLLPIFAIIYLLFNSRYIKSDNVIKSWFKCPNISSPLVFIQTFNFHMVHSLIFDILSCILDSSVMIYYQQM